MVFTLAQKGFLYTFETKDVYMYVYRINMFVSKRNHSSNNANFINKVLKVKTSRRELPVNYFLFKSGFGNCLLKNSTALSLLFMNYFRN